MKTILSILFLSFISTTPVFGQNALNFDGTDDHILTTVTGITGNSARTIEARIKTTANALPVGSGGTGQKVIVDWGATGTGQRSTFNVLFNNAIRFEVAGNGVNGTIPINDGLWHHVAVVLDPTATDLVSLYVDGVLDISGTPTVTVNTATTNKIRIGRRIDNVSSFEGDIDEVRVWNVARTQAELQANMNDELCTLPSSLILYCPLNSGIASGTNTGLTNAIDYSVSSGVCTLTNFGLTGAASNWITGYTYGPGFIIGGASLANSCGTYTWAANGQFYTSSGFYQTSVPSSTGCDSIIGLNLTINTNTFATQVETACSSYTWPLNGQTYTTSGIQNTTIPNSAGCDSIISLALTITGPFYGNDDITACNQYTWPVNGITYNGTTSVVDTISSSTSCDSIITLNLTIVGPTFSTQTVSSCGDYYWPVDSMTYSTSGMFDVTLTNSIGCDSIITLDLTISAPLDLSVTNNNDLNLVANQSGAQYQWINCMDSIPIAGQTDQTLLLADVSSGIYAVIITTSNCTDTSECTWLAWQSLDEHAISTFKLFPNPSSESIEISSSTSMNGVIQILDVQGKLVHTEMISQSNSHKMDVSRLNEGLYFVKIQSENGYETLRLIKRD